MFKTSLSICCFLGVWGGLKVVEVNTIKSANQWWIIAEQTNHLRCTGGVIITLNCIVRNPQKRVIGPVRPWGGTRGAIFEQRAAAAWLAMAFKSGSQLWLLWAGRGLADRKKSSVHYATEWDGVMCDIKKAFYHHVLSSGRRICALDIKWRVESESQTGWGAQRNERALRRWCAERALGIKRSSHCTIVHSFSILSTKRLGTEMFDLRGASGTKRSWRRRVVRGSSLQVRFPPVCIAVRVRSREPGSRLANCRLDERHKYIRIYSWCFYGYDGLSPFMQR